MSLKQGGHIKTNLSLHKLTMTNAIIATTGRDVKHALIIYTEYVQTLPR